MLTAYCYIEDVAHIELNGHILIPLQNIASLHCSSRCDAPEPDWPPRGLAEDEPRRHSTARRPWLAARNLAEGLALPRRRAAAFGRARLVARRLRLGVALRVLRRSCSRRRSYWYADRVALGMVGARELPLARRRRSARPSSGSPLARASRSRGSTSSRTTATRARFRPGAGRAAAAVAVRRAAARARRPSSRACSRTSSRTSRNRDVLVQTPRRRRCGGSSS